MCCSAHIFVREIIHLIVDGLDLSVYGKEELGYCFKGMTLGALQTLDSQLSQGVRLSTLSGWPNLGLLLPPAWAAWCHWALQKGPLWCGTETSLSSWWWSWLATADTHFAWHERTFTWKRLRVSFIPRLHGENLPLLYLLFLNWCPLSISLLIRKLKTYMQKTLFVWILYICLQKDENYSICISPAKLHITKVNF